MGKDEPHLRISGGRAARQQALDCTRRIGTIFDSGVTDSRNDVPAAEIILGMRVDDGSPPIQFFVNRRKQRVTKVLVSVKRSLPKIGEQIDSVPFQSSV